MSLGRSSGAPFGSGLVALAIAALTVCRVLTPDSYLSLYAGRYIDQHGIPHHDPFTVAGHGRVWIDQQWLFHLVAYDLWRVDGYRAVGLASALAYATAIALLVVAIRRRGVSTGPAMVAVAPAAIVLLTHVQIWAEVAALPLFMATVVVLLGQSPVTRLTPAALWSLPILALWANVHGSVLLGAALVAAYATWRLVRDGRSWIAGALIVGAAACVLITPYGWEIEGYYRSVLGSSAIRQELPIWNHATLSDFYSRELFLLVAISIGFLVAARRKGRLIDPVIVAGALVLMIAGLESVRNQTWFCFGQAILLADCIGALWSRRLLTPGGWRLLGVLSVVAAVGAVVAQQRTGDAFYERLAPMGALPVIAHSAEADGHATILADFTTSNPLLWHYPSLAGRVAFDTRIEVFDPAEARRWLRFNEAKPGWRRLAAEYRLVAASGHVHLALVDAIRSDPVLRTLYYRDNDVVASNPAT